MARTKKSTKNRSKRRQALSKDTRLRKNRMKARAKRHAGRARKKRSARGKK